MKTEDNMQHKIGEYLFDSDRLIVYKGNVDQKTTILIDEVYSGSNTDNQAKLELEQHNADKMKMDRIATDKIGICLTYNCNLRCNYCGYSSTNSDKNELQFENIQAFIKDAIRKRAIRKLITKKNEPLQIYFTGGGEPTYNWKLFTKVVSYIRDVCSRNEVPLWLRMTSNGILRDEQIGFISKNFNELMISYDGLPEIQNTNRKGPGINDSNRIVENTIRKISQNKVPLTIRSTMWQGDYSKIKDMYHHVFSLVPTDSIVTWSVYPTLYEGRAIKGITQEDYMNEFLSHYIELVNYVISTEGEKKLNKIDVPLFNNDLCGVFCGAYRNIHPWLLPDGSIVTCIESKDNAVRVGSVEDGNIKYYDEYCDTFLKIAQEKYYTCRSCIAYRFCKGGCPVWHLRIGKKHNEAFECSLQKEYWGHDIQAALNGGYSFGWRLKETSFVDDLGSPILKLIK